MKRKTWSDDILRGEIDLWTNNPTRIDGDSEISVSLKNDRFSQSTGLCDVKDSKLVNLGVIIFPLPKKKHGKQR